MVNSDAEIADCHAVLDPSGPRAFPRKRPRPGGGGGGGWAVDIRRSGILISSALDPPVSQGPRTSACGEPSHLVGRARGHRCLL